MDHDSDLVEFNGIVRLFPLPEVVQFPYSVLPLHIFEPRYRQMMEDALDSDQLITIVQLKGKTEFVSPGVRAVEKIGCLGKILQHERLPDGRFNLLLRGVTRVRLTEEIPSGKLYRTCRATLLEDIDDGTGGELTVELIAQFRRFLMKTSGQVAPEVARLFEPDMPLGLLTDMLGHSLPLGAQIKQTLLGEPRVTVRAQMLSTLLTYFGKEAPASPTGGGGFPPSFSVN